MTSSVVTPQHTQQLCGDVGSGSEVAGYRNDYGEPDDPNDQHSRLSIGSRLL
ncbi:MAG: hypothetical protein OXI96_00975 [Acidimicrobiaceae bacterium]|nr:hypothetical protein [Acidimicrobiaceae bacterium]